MPPLPLKITKKHHRHLNNPFPSQPKSLPFIHGALSSNPATLPHHQVYPIGKDFSLTWSCGSGGCLSISHQSQPTRALWSTTPGEAFASAAVVRTEVEESRGSFAVKDGEVLAICKHQSVEEIRVLYRSDLDRRGREHDLLFDGFLQADPKVQSFEVFEGIQFPVCLITGWVFTKKKTGNLAHGNARVGGGRRFWHGRSRRPPITARYWVLLDQKNSSQIGFQVKFGDINRQPGIISPKKFRLSSSSLRWKLIPQRERRGWCFWRPRGFASIPSDDEGEPEKLRSLGFNRVFITYSSEEDERFYGFGEQFSHVEFKGKRVPILVQEQGIGRGDQPISFAANLVSYRAGGNWSTTYAPSPFYITSKMRSLYLEGYDYSVFDLTKQDKVQIQVYSQSAQGRILHGNSPVELVERFTDTIGRPPKLPNWIISGAIIGMQGGTKDVRNVWQQLQNYDVPISAFWLQDWVGQRKTIIGSQLWWNWELDSTHYSEWPQLIKEFHSSNIKVMAYCNPCLALTDQKPNKNRNMFKEAESIGILVKDKSGAPYMVPNTAFDVGMLDFTHPKASSWFKNILRDMVDSGIQGWMADFGEGLPLDGTLYSGEDPVSAHNKYPELWARVNKEFVDEWKLSLREKDGEDPDESLVFFMRAGFRNSPKWAMLFWEGDQMVSWQNHDGIKSSVVGLLSSGISGFAFNHSDIGGYCTINLPLFKYNRSEELLMRWMELNAFNIVFRTHEGNKPSSNCQFYSNNSTLSHFARFAKVYQAWRFYRIQLVEEAAQKGLPVCRHLFLHYPDDEHVHSLTYQQFLVGSEILVVPVLDKGKKEVKAYFPTGGGCSWQHIWTGRVFSKPSKISSPTEQGFEEWVEAPIGYPAIFVKFGSLVGETFLKNLRDQKIMLYHEIQDNLQKYHKKKIDMSTPSEMNMAKRQRRKLLLPAFAGTESRINK